MITFKPKRKRRAPSVDNTQDARSSKRPTNSASKTTTASLDPTNTSADHQNPIEQNTSTFSKNDGIRRSTRQRKPTSHGQLKRSLSRSPSPSPSPKMKKTKAQNPAQQPKASSSTPQQPAPKPASNNTSASKSMTCQAVETRFVARELINHIYTLKDINSTFPPITCPAKDEFYLLFSSSHTFPSQANDDAVWKSVSEAWDSILGPENFGLKMRSGHVAVDSLLGWVSRIRSHDRWMPADDRQFLRNLAFFRDQLCDSKVPVPPVPQTSSHSQQPTSTAPAALPPPVSQPSFTSQEPTSVAPDAPPLSDDPHALHPEGNCRPLPAAFAKALSQIEEFASEGSSIPVGTKEDKFYQEFCSFTLPHLDHADELWENIDGPLNSVIGRDKVKEHLRRGMYGADGLLRSWITSARFYQAWTSAVDGVFLPKLEGIVELFRLSHAPMTAPTPPPPSTQSPMQTPTMGLQARYTQRSIGLESNDEQPQPTTIATPNSNKSSAPSSPALLQMAQILKETSKSSSADNQQPQASSSTLSSIGPLTIMEITPSLSAAVDQPQPSSLNVPPSQPQPSSSKYPSSMDEDKSDIEDGPTGTPLPVSCHVYDPRFASGRPTIWQSPTPALELSCESSRVSRLNLHDCQQLYNQVGKLLYLRLSAPMAIKYDPLEQVCTTPPLVSTRMGMGAWIEQEPSKLVLPIFFLAGLQWLTIDF